MTTPNDRTHEPGDDYLDDEDMNVVVDPDFILLGRYLGDELTREERRDVEARSRSDPAFWGKIGPLVGLFALDAAFDKRAFMKTFGTLPTSELALDERPATAPTRLAPPLAPPAFLPAHRPTADLPEPLPAFQDVRSPSWLNRALEPGPAWKALDTVAHIAWKTIKWVVGLFISLVIVLVLLRNWKPLVVVESKLFFHMSAADSSALAVATTEDILDTHLGRAVVGGTGQLIQDSAGPGEKRIVIFDDRSRAVVLPESRVAFRIPKTALSRIASPSKHTVTIDGEVIFTALEPWRLNTRIARIEVTPGSYAIRSTPHAGVLQLSVGTGSAYVYVRGEQDSIHVVRGDYLSVPATGAVRITHDSTGFPLFGDTTSIHNLRKGP